MLLRRRSRHTGIQHTHILRYSMQHTAVGYVGVESEDCICKVPIWAQETGMNLTELHSLVESVHLRTR